MSVRQLNLRVGEDIETSPLTEKNVKPKGIAINDHLSLCNHSPSFNSFKSATQQKQKKFIRVERKSIINDRPSLNRKNRSSPLDMNGVKMG